MISSFAIETAQQWTSQIKRPSLIAVAGCTCAGKSTFCANLQDLLPKESVILKLDDYFRDIRDPLLPRSSDHYPIFDEPGSYHIDEYIESINRLLSGGDVLAPIYDIATNQRINRTNHLKATPIIIADGLFVIDLLQQFSPHLFIYVEADTETCLNRRIARDTQLFGVSEIVIRRHFEQQILPRQQTFIEPQKRKADIVVTTF